MDLTPFRSTAVANIQLLCDKLVAVLLSRAYGDRDILLTRMRTLMQALDRPPSSPEEWSSLRTAAQQAAVMRLEDQQRRRAITSTMDALADLRFPLSDQDSSLLWQAASSPMRVETILTRVEAVLQTERQRLIVDLDRAVRRLSEDLRSLAVRVSKLEEFSELDAADEAAELAHEVQDVLEDCHNRAQLFESHARMLERDAPDLSALQTLHTASAPITELWLAASEWATNSAAWLAAPFRSLDVVSMEPEAQRAYERAQALVKRLASHPNPNPPAVSLALREKISIFRQHLPLFVRLGHTGMRPHHWLAISNAAHVERMLFFAALFCLCIAH